MTRPTAPSLRRLRRRPDGERGSGTVLSLALGAGVVVVLALVGLVAGSLTAHARAQGAADLAALAAAARGQRLVFFGTAELAVAAGGSDPGVGGGAPTGRTTGDVCPAARDVAARNGVRMTGCEPGAAGTVTVTVATEGPAGVVTAQARAGPRPSGGSS